MKASQEQLKKDAQQLLERQNQNKELKSYTSMGVKAMRVIGNVLIALLISYLIVVQLLTLATMSEVLLVLDLPEASLVFDQMTGALLLLALMGLVGFILKFLAWFLTYLKSER